MKTSIWTMLLGLLMILAGAVAIIHPFMSSLMVTLFAGWSFIILGILQIIGAFTDASGGRRVLLLILGIAMAWAGWVVLSNPIAGLLALTAAVAISFIATGIVKLALGWQVRSGSFGIWIILSGLLSLVLGVVFLANMIDTATWLLGFLLGIELISDGVAAIALWYHHRNA